MGLRQTVNALPLRAHPDATTAEDALVGVANDAGAGQVLLVVLTLAGEVAMTNAHGVGQTLEFAVAVALTGVTILRMVVEQQFDDVTPGLAQVLRVGMDLHAVGHGTGAGGHEVAGPFHLDDADATGPFDGQLG